MILITNVIDEVNAHQIASHLRTLSGRHLPLGVLLRDHALFDAVDSLDWDRLSGNLPPQEQGLENSPSLSDTQVLPPQIAGPELYRAAAAAEILSWRHRVITDLEMSGVLALDTFPENLAAPLVNRYLDIKARHLL